MLPFFVAVSGCWTKFSAVSWASGLITTATIVLTCSRAVSSGGKLREGQDARLLPDGPSRLFPAQQPGPDQDSPSESRAELDEGSGQGVQIQNFRLDLAFSELGDINLVGFNDLAVGAPYDGPRARKAPPTSSTGPARTRKGIRTKASQVIYDEELDTFGFGFSLAGCDGPGRTLIEISAKSVNAQSSFSLLPEAGHLTVTWFI